LAGIGLQVRDVLHVDDLYDLLRDWTNTPAACLMWAAHARTYFDESKYSGRTIELGHVPEKRYADSVLCHPQAVTRTRLDAERSRDQLLEAG
jgi:hypothetical protein